MDDPVFPDGHQVCSGQGGTSRLQLPILVEDFYPANTYSVQYYLKVNRHRLQYYRAISNFKFQTSTFTDCSTTSRYKLDLH